VLIRTVKKDYQIAGVRRPSRAKESLRKPTESYSIQQVGWLDKQKKPREVTEGTKYAADPLKQLALDGLRDEIETMVPRVKQVMEKARARIFRGDTRSEGQNLQYIRAPRQKLSARVRQARPMSSARSRRYRKAKTRSWLTTRSMVNDPATEMC
jgi:transposase, IS5 family